MAMPASGSIAIISAPQACGSICAAVGVASGSLTTLSVAAGKTAPHAMTEFYNYSPAKDINFCQYYYNGGDGGGNSCSCTCTYSTPAMVSPESYCLCTFYNLCVDFSQSPSALACICITCNGVGVLYCCVNYSTFCANAAFSRTVDYNDVIRIINRAYTNVLGCSGGVRSQICISTIVPISGSFDRGTTCCNICRYTDGF